MARLGRIIAIACNSVVVLAVGLLFVVFNFSVSNEFFVCDGNVKDSNQGSPQPDKAYVEIGTYRWWVSLWSYNKSEGMLTAQLENYPASIYYDYVNFIGDIPLKMATFSSAGQFSGGLRYANGEITLRIIDQVNFVGLCSRGAPKL